METLTDLLASLNGLNIEDSSDKIETDSRGAGAPELPVKVAYINQNRLPRFTNHNYIGKFGINGSREYVEEPEPVYLHLPNQRKNLNINLNRGYNKSKLFDGHYGEDGYKGYRKIKKEYFIRWMADSDYLNTNEDNSIKFVAWSGNISDILITPFEKKEDWVLHATRFRNHIFLDKIKEPELDNHYSRLSVIDTIKSNTLGYHGVKFFQLMTSKNRSEDPDSMNKKLKDGVNEDEKQFHVFEAEFGVHKLLSVCELDAVNPGSDARTELKIFKEPNYLSDHEWLRKYKYLQLWAKCSICDIPDVVYGLRKVIDNTQTVNRHLPVSGYLKELITIKSKNIEDECKHFWSPAICLNFLDRVLNFIKEKVNDDDPRSVTEISWFIDDNKLTSKNVTQEHSSLLPEWFIEK